MNAHQHYQDLLPLYAVNQLNDQEAAAMKAHLDTCAECQADLELWRAVGTEIQVSNAKIVPWPDLTERALKHIHATNSLRRVFQRAFSLLRAQAYLIRREMWPAAALLMGIGMAVSYLVGKVEVIRFIAPLIAAASLATIYGPEYDPASELTLATPTSPWKVLLARLTLVHAYNLTLALIASLFVLTFQPVGLLESLILDWLGPMTFLSALALLLSLWIGATNSVAITYVLWLAQYPRYDQVIDPTIFKGWLPVLETYRLFWSNALLLIGLGLLLWLVALVIVRSSIPRLLQNQV